MPEPGDAPFTPPTVRWTSSRDPRPRSCELCCWPAPAAGAILMPSPRRKLEAARKAASAHEAASLPMTVVSLSVKNAAAAAAPSTSKDDGLPEVNTAKASAQYYRDALTRTLTELGWRQATGFPSPRCAIVWHDEPLRLQHLLALPRGARINRFYGMVRICRKVCLARLLDACGRLHPAAFGGAAPRTWCVGASWPQGAAFE